MSRVRREASDADLRVALSALSDRLAERDGPASIYVVGGAAIAARHDERRLTVDIMAPVPSHPVVPDLRRLSCLHACAYSLGWGKIGG